MAGPTDRSSLRRPPRWGDWLGALLSDRIAIDLRALAAVRIALGGLIVLDLLLRARDFTAFYTDDGVLPASALYADYSQVYSLHAIVADAWLVALLFVVAAVFGVLLALGYRTRTVTIVSWLLLFSLHERNPMVLNGGDVLFRMLLFWGIFLPLGERWSIDARRRENDARRRNRDRDRARRSVATVASAAILAQVVVVYVSNFVHKGRSDAWLRGDAVPYILSLDQMTVLLGPYLAEFPTLLVAVNYVWLFLMATAPFLLLLTGWPRAVLASGFVGMHVGMGLALQMAVFPLVAVTGLLLFYQAPVWDAAERIAERRGISDRLRALDRRIEAVLPSPSLPSRNLLSRPLDELATISAFSPLSVARRVRTTVVPAVFLSLVLLTNAHALGYADAPPDAGQELLETTDTDQSWQLFAPNPLEDTRWYVANGTLENGEHVDPLNGGKVTYDRPPDPADHVGNARWRKYLSNVYATEFGSNDDHQSYLADYLCASWNRSHDTSMESVEIIVLSERGTPFGGDEPERKRLLITYDCSDPLVQS